MSFPARKIGNTKVAAIGYGAMGIAVGYGEPLPDEQRFKVRRSLYMFCASNIKSVRYPRYSMLYMKILENCGSQHRCI